MYSQLKENCTHLKWYSEDLPMEDKFLATGMCLFTDVVILETDWFKLSNKWQWIFLV